MISETKLDESFPSMQFNIDGYNIFRSDQNAKGDGILMYVRDDIPCKLIPMRNSTIEGFFIELKLRKKKWLLCCSYNPHRRFISNHLIDIGRNLDLLSTNYDNILLLGDFNAEVENNFLKEFCDLYGMKSLIRIPTCYKNPANPACIDLMLTNSNRSFQNSCTIETGLSDFHKMIVTVLKIYFQKREAKVINYRDYRNFSNEEFRQQVLKDILKATQNGDIVSYESFLSICQQALDSRAPKKQKYVRSNHSPFINKTIMDRSRLRKKSLKTRSNEDKKAYNTQRNYCLTLFRKAKKDYYNNLDHENVTDNETFWKSIKPLVSEKGPTHNKITFVKQDLILDKNDLNIPKYHGKSANIDHIDDSIARSIEQYKNHPSIVAVKSHKRHKSIFQI